MAEVVILNPFTGEFDIAGVSDAIPVPAAWGGITGSLPDQTDLHTALGEKQDTRVVSILTVTASIPAGSTLNITASGSGYVFSGAAGNLQISEILFLADNGIEILVNGIGQDKESDLTWISSQSFQLNLALDVTDKVTIYS